MRKARLLAVVAGLALLSLLLGWAVRENARPPAKKTPLVAGAADAGGRASGNAARPRAARGARTRATSVEGSASSGAEVARSQSSEAGDASIAGSAQAPTATDDEHRAQCNVAPPVREAKGLVVDAATQAPVVGARVLLAVLDGKYAGTWFGDTTKADGRFRPSTDEPEYADAKFELRVSKDGYEPVRVPVGDGETRIELRPRNSPVLPGRVVGLARGADGKPFVGALAVEGFDEHGGNATQHVVADAAGAFVLEGVPPGTWRLRFAGGKSAETFVPEDGETRVEVAAPTDEERSSFVVTDCGVITDFETFALCAENPKAKERLDALIARRARIESDGKRDDDAREKALRDVAQETQSLAAEVRAALPRRDVVVTGLPTDARAWLRLETKPREFRRVEAEDGVARFACVPTDSYSAVLVVPGRPERSWPLDVPSGEGAFETSSR